MRTQYDRYRELADEFQRELRRLETDQRQIQLRAFLESQFIDAARIPGIYTTDHMALASYGIETAADVSPEALRVVPGFGQHLGRQRTAALLAWRQELEHQFLLRPPTRAPIQPPSPACGDATPKSDPGSSGNCWQVPTNWLKSRERFSNNAPRSRLP
ncbi:MAG: hypothetical protein U5O69_07670 [Candidatus Competibacteraceae bacterium]|nr:hypothetical protein [Candidatus Competibacteraceae bacterium]